MHPDTAAVRAGAIAVPVNRASSPPLFQASSYEFADLADIEAIYSGERAGKIYGREGGPNAQQFEAAMAELEGAPAAVGAAAGMSAINAALTTNLRTGDTVVATAEAYGGTYHLLERDIRDRGIRVVYVDQSDLSAVRHALAEHRPAVLYLEAITNPLVHVADLPALATLAREFGALSIVDATFATPILIRPLAAGINLVIHSVGKYLGGHGDVGAGVIVGDVSRVAKARSALVLTGATMPHFEAWLALRGLRTLALRMHRHSANAVAVARFLATAKDVRRVHHPSQAGHPQHALAARLYPEGTGGMLAFELNGGASVVDAFLRGLTMISIVHSLGEVATTIAYPAVSSHRPLPAELRHKLGVGDGTLRLSAGIEAAADITADLARALAGLSQQVRA